MIVQIIFKQAGWMKGVGVVGIWQLGGGDNSGDDKRMRSDKK